VSEAKPNERPLWAWLALWLCVPVLELYLAWPDRHHIGLWQMAFELTIFGLLGWAQWRFVQHDELRHSPLGPAAVLFGLASLNMAFPLLVKIPFLLGVVALLGVALKLSGRWRLPLVVGAVLACGARVGEDIRRLSATADAFTMKKGSPVMDLLAWPLAPASPLPPPHPVGPPVVVITIDTLRADDAESMPSLVRLAEHGAWWPRAMSTSSWTLPSLASLQTGLLPQEHGAGCLPDRFCQGIAPGTPLLAQELAARGYRNAAFVANVWLARTTGFAEGFHDFRSFTKTPIDLKLDPVKTRATYDAHTVVDQAVSWLQSNEHPSFYLWVHLLDPHMPYVHAPEPELRGKLGRDLRVGTPPWSPQRQAAYRTAYRREVAKTDEALGRLLDALEAQGVLDRGIVVFAADHGEEFWDHGDIGHGHSHHGEVVDIPLLLVAPGLQQRGRRTDLASLVDVVPTVRAVLGEPPGGIDLRLAIPPDRIALSYGNTSGRFACAARGGERRVIVPGCDPLAHPVGYDLRTDPTELQGAVLSPSDPLVQAATRLAPPQAHGEAMTELDALKALGYVD
jgi:hypothetical protein